MTAITTLPCATIDSIKSKLCQYNLDNCKTIILLVSGNDSDNGTNLETFIEKYEKPLNSLLANDHRVIVAGLLPREIVDLKPYNNRLRQFCDACETEVFENYNFLLASGELPNFRDKLHRDNNGAKKCSQTLLKCKV